ncbi:MAG TPA: hypothetical protein DD473_27665 [Planctomycetaceae bacterium]|nr:hypothetical protein [Planctomycetaceae bacterium]|tara:strand:+ start:82 stop:1047 length:966 start_codon:yes stop_codon:yes gene_type:complete
MPAERSDSVIASYRYAVDVTRAAGSNFHIAFRILPEPMYRAMCTIYAYMRISDDLVDGSLSENTSSLPETSAVQSLANWQKLTANLKSSHSTSHPLFPALEDVLGNYPIEVSWLLAVLDGMQRDLNWSPFADFEELACYCDQVAGMSGLCCQAIWGADLEQTRKLALTCGRAFQMTNILRDVHEDTIRGRCYFPQNELDHFGCQNTNWDDPQIRSNWLDLIAFQVKRTESFYREASELERHLSGPGRRMFRIMFVTYRAVLRKISRNPQLVFHQKVRVSKSRKLIILLAAPYLSVLNSESHANAQCSNSAILNAKVPSPNG